MTKWIVVSMLLLAVSAWGEEAKKTYPCDDPKTHEVSHICDDGVNVIPYCDAPTYGTMPRVMCWDHEAKERTTFGQFATAKPLEVPKHYEDNWVCVDEKNYKMYSCDSPGKNNNPNAHLEKGGNWMCLDHSDGKLKKCQDAGDHWSVLRVTNAN